MIRIRKVLVGMGAVAIAAALLSFPIYRVHRERTHDGRLLRAYQNLPQPVRSRAEAMLRSSAPAAVAEDTAFRIQAVIDEALVPVPILNGRFEQVLQPLHPCAPVLNEDQQNRILKVSQSVGRITTALPGGGFQLAGTGFVVKRGVASAVVATNCHVLVDCSIGLEHTPPPEGTPVSTQLGLRIDLSDGAKQEDTRAFAVTRILPCTQTKGLDVALLLHVASTMAGESGSPVIEIGASGEPVVTGIHSCCRSPGGILPTDNPALNCATRLLSKEFNLSIAI